MLTKKQNLLECIRGGNPDRIVNQWEAFSRVIANPVVDRTLDADGRMVDEWGVWFQVAGQPGRMPMHDMEHRVIKDFDEWEEQLTTIPKGCWDNAAIWEPLQAQAEAIDKNEQFVMATVFPGMFERLHDLGEITETLMALYDSPDEVHEIMKIITEVELEQAEAICKYLKPDALLHHDDWGTAKSTFMKPEMFEEFFLDSYKQVYKYYKDHGVEVLIHHSDTYGATLVPYMIEMGVDIWQGCLLRPNELNKLVDQYGGQISFMGGIDSDAIDKPDWTPESVKEGVYDAMDYMGMADRRKFYIPCLTQGVNISTFPGVLEEVSKCISEYEAEHK